MIKKLTKRVLEKLFDLLKPEIKWDSFEDEMLLDTTTSRQRIYLYPCCQKMYRFVKDNPDAVTIATLSNTTSKRLACSIFYSLVFHTVIKDEEMIQRYKTPFAYCPFCGKNLRKYIREVAIEAIAEKL